jgi:hypothetical protein
MAQMSNPISIVVLLGFLLQGPLSRADDRQVRLAELNQPIVLKFEQVAGASALVPPLAADALQVCINGRPVAWATPQLDWIGKRILVRLMGPNGDADAGAHARALRRMMHRSFGGNQLAVCVKTSAGACTNLVVSLGGVSYRDTLWLAILLGGILLPVFVPRLVRTRVRESNGKRSGWERFSLSAFVFYIWSIAVLASIVFVWAATGEWTVNQTAMSLLGLAAAIRGGAVQMPGSRLGAIGTQPVLPAAVTTVPPQPFALPPIMTADPGQPGPAPQPAAPPPTGDAEPEPSPTALAAVAQPLLRIFSQTLTDSDGPAMNRIQLAGWTAILVCWYLRAVYLDWALPAFNISLMGIGAASGGLHVLSKSGEQISRNNLTPTRRTFSMSSQRSPKAAATTAGVYLIGILMLACAVGSGMAQGNVKKGAPQKGAGGATPAAGAPALPGGSANGAPAGGAADSNKPADREWKLVNQPLMLLPPDDQKLLSTRPPHLDMKNVKALVDDLRTRDVVPPVPDSDRKNCTDKSAPWIIQTAVFDTTQDDAKPVRVETYLYDPRKPPKEQKDLQRTRIYGSKTACFMLAAYVAAAAVESPGGRSLARGDSQLGSDGADFKPMPGEPGTNGGTAGPAVYVKKANLKFAQFYAAKQKTPAPLQDFENLLTLAGVLQSAQADKGPTPTVPTWIFGLNQVDNLPLPSDMWLQTGAPGGEFNPTDFTTLSKEVQFDNEGYYWYDFSITLPVNKVDALEYNGGDSTVQTKQTDLKTVYATANLFLMKADIKDPSTLWVPRLLFGIGIRGKPYDRMFVGAGFGFGFLHWAPLQAVQPFAGLSFNRTYVKDGTGTSTVLTGRSVRKLVIGINVPVKSVADRLKSSGK